MSENNVSTPKSEPPHPAELPPKLNGAPPLDQPEVKAEPQDQPKKPENPGLVAGETADDGSAESIQELITRFATAEAALPKELGRTTPTPSNAELFAMTPDADIAAYGTIEIVSIVCTKPKKQWWFRTHPDPSYVWEGWCIEVDDAEDLYPVAPALVGLEVLQSLVRPYRIYTCINHHEEPFLFKCPIPQGSGPNAVWHQSRLRIAERGKETWVGMRSQRGAKGYRLFRREGNHAEPEFEKLPAFTELFDLAFTELLITRADDPRLIELAGKLEK